MFVKVVGSKGYSQLFFFASLCSLAYYLYFALRGHKQNEPYNVYRAVLIIAFLASFGCFLQPYWPALQPANALLLYFFVVSIMTVDLVGTTLGPIVLQSTVNPAIFRQVFQRIVAVELMARITAALIVWVLSTTHLLTLLYPIAWALLLVHFVLFGVTVWRMRVSEIKARIPRGDRRPVLENVGSSLRFMFSNPLVRVAMTAMVWATITKFVIENLFYQGADAQFGSAAQLASFVSLLTIFIFSLSFAFHLFLNRAFNNPLQLRTLLSIQPVNVLLLAGIALLLPPFWPLVLLMVTYNIIHRSIELPMSRQCLVPIPRKQRATIVALISIVIALATILTSGVMSVLKNSLQMEDFLVFLLILGSGILFVVTSLDSYYIRNLWSLFQETRSGSWQDNPQLENISEFELDTASDTTIKESSKDEELAIQPILEKYALSSDRAELQSVATAHHSLLSSNRVEQLLTALRICFVSGFPWLKRPLTAAAGHQESRVRTFAERAMLIDREFGELFDHSAVFRRRVKVVAMDLLESDDNQQCLSDLKDLLKLTDYDAVESIVATLADVRFRSLRGEILQCIINGGKRLTVMPIVERMFAFDYDGAQIYRELLNCLHFGKNSSELRTAIEANLAKLERQPLGLGKTRANGDVSDDLKLFMHTLFIEEYRLLGNKRDKALTDTIAGFPSFSQEESGILVDMHLSFLKRSDLYQSWQAIMLSCG